MATRSTDLNVTPAALVSHTMIRIQGDQDGDMVKSRDVVCEVVV